MAEKFKVGDVVQLKSGGPSMTVTMVKPLENRDYDYVYLVHWNALKHEFMEGDFPAFLLRAVPE